MKIRLRATKRHMPCGTTQCHLPSDAGKRTPP